MSHHRLTICLGLCTLAGFASLEFGHTQPAEKKRESFVRHVDGGMKPHDLGDLSEILHIQQMEGQVQLNSGFRNMSVVFEAFKDGKPIELPDSIEHTGANYETWSTVRYALQIADLDFLPLGNAKKEHCRIRIAFGLPDDSTLSFERDIPKQVIDLSNASNMTFTETASTNADVPVFWFAAGGTIPVTVDASYQLTKGEVLERVKQGSLFIISLRFNDADNAKASE